MGLDMYLHRMPRYKGATAEDVYAVTEYLDWKQQKAAGNEYAQCSFERWCGIEEVPCEEYLKFYQQHFKATYSEWDTEKKHPWWRIMEEIGYWRKANAIHRWFVETVQNGIDDCEYHREVTKADLEALRDTCAEVLCKPNLANKMLPTQSGFFFGSVELDEWYIENLRTTIEICEEAIATTDFDKQMIYYRSSW